MLHSHFNIVFFGTSEFATLGLERLVSEGHNVKAVVTCPDCYKRGKKLIESPVKICAKGLGLSILQPPSLSDPDFIQALKNLGADIFVVIAFKFLPSEIYQLPREGSINVHASLLPKYRGAAPINWAIINGETETGVTIFKLAQEIDTGDILGQTRVEIGPTESFQSLYGRLMEVSGDLLSDVLGAWENIKPARQDPHKISRAPKIFHSTQEIDFNAPADRVYNFIRGMNGGAWTIIDGREVKIITTESITGKPQTPGHIESDGKTYLRIGTQDGWIEVHELQPSGKKPMRIKDYLNGRSRKINLDRK